MQVFFFTRSRSKSNYLINFNPERIGFSHLFLENSFGFITFMYNSLSIHSDVMYDLFFSEHYFTDYISIFLLTCIIGDLTQTKWMGPVAYYLAWKRPFTKTHSLKLMELQLIKNLIYQIAHIKILQYDETHKSSFPAFIKTKWKC